MLECPFQRLIAALGIAPDGFGASVSASHYQQFAALAATGEFITALWLTFGRVLAYVARDCRKVVVLVGFHLLIAAAPGNKHHLIETNANFNPSEFWC